MEENIFYKPGDIVQIKQDIPNKPLMIVVKKETSLFKNNMEDKKNVLKGIRCRWFTTTGQLQETVWNTKDLQLVNESRSVLNKEYTN